ncbi:hypothetical protein [Iodobacter fluviatilis]|uniref:Uncharacterized protein n=1 Tax=Iodobacter fluviatilis TaxID=537 RepID=A0A7G3GDE6_9NEIS|nr:hypothetical protein [Iodobacter fluviatilis]QBC45188.1 hypothetical protein C1H71_17715 [Iodobacter fluviatilis]
MQDKMEKYNEYKNISVEEFERMNIREKELMMLRQQIHMQERELDKQKSKLKEEQLSREKAIQKEMDAREKFFSEREKNLYERQREFERELQLRQVELESLRNDFENSTRRKEQELEEEKILLHLEKERYNEESRIKIETKSNDYVTQTLEILRSKEDEFHGRSKSWAAIGAFSIFCSLAFFIEVTMSSYLTAQSGISWQFIVFIVFKGVIAITMFAALAKYALIFSNAYMKEALKNADRRHAINFGKFYLESYGAAADWPQIKEAFEHWNINGDNLSSKNTKEELDITTIEKFASVIEKISKALSSSKKD